jgi:fructoselysine-6-P-deglycase FrlB-like protein
MITDDAVLSRNLGELPATVESAIDEASRWGRDALNELETVPRAALTCATGAGWAAALEAALLLKEVARVPTEGGETREAATSGMYPLASHDLAFTLPSGGEDPLLEEAEKIFESAGAKVLRAPAPRSPIDERVTGVAMFPAAAALAIKLARLGGFDPDEPTWAATYYETAR